MVDFHIDDHTRETCAVAEQTVEVSPDVPTRKITDNDADEKHGALLVQAGDPRIE